MRTLASSETVVKVESTDTVAQSATPQFDAFTFEFWSTVVNGAHLLVVDGGQPFDIRRLLSAFADWQPSVAFITTSLLHALIDVGAAEINGLRLLIFGGEKCDAARIMKLRRRTGGLLINVYGPTETTVFTTAHPVTSDDSALEEIPLGQPLPWAKLFLHNDGGFAAFPWAGGQQGELWIGGDGLAAGYVSGSAEDRARFVGNCEHAGARYRTGDILMAAPDGSLLFAGRTDHQIKRRGHRIELDQISSLLKAHPAVHDAATTASQREGTSSKTIASFVTLRSRSAETTLNAWSQVYDQLYSSVETFDGVDQFIGWNDREQNSEIPRDEMSAWLTTTSARIERIAGDSLLELGVGTGMLLRSLSPRVERYVATDISRRAIEVLQLALPQEGDSRVQLHVADAVSFLSTTSERFDTIVLNSVVQYFPSREYLNQVVQLCSEALAPGGRLFLGDLIAGASMGSRHISRDELQIEPEYFEDVVAASSNSFTGCLTEVKEIEALNIVSLYRYDAVLTTREVGAAGSARPPADCVRVPTPSRSGGLQPGTQVNPVHRFYREAAGSQQRAVASWSSDREEYVVLHMPRRSSLEELVLAQRSCLEGESRQNRSAVEEPDVDYFAGSETAMLFDYLQGLLPDYQHPDSITVVEEFPLTRNGKLDTRRLEAVVSQPVQGAGAAYLPQSWQAWALQRLVADARGVSPQLVHLGEPVFRGRGSSLAVTSFVGSARTRLGLDLSLHEVYAADARSELRKVVLPGTSSPEVRARILVIAGAAEVRVAGIPHDSVTVQAADVLRSHLGAGPGGDAAQVVGTVLKAVSALQFPDVRLARWSTEHDDVQAVVLESFNLVEHDPDPGQPADSVIDAVFEYAYEGTEESVDPDQIIAIIL